MIQTVYLLDLRGLSYGQPRSATSAIDPGGLPRVTLGLPVSLAAGPPRIDLILALGSVARNTRA
jgi:hypothetical protein